LKGLPNLNESQRRYLIDNVIPEMELAVAKTPALFHDWFIDLLAWSCKHNPTFNAAKDLFSLIDRRELGPALDIVCTGQGAAQIRDGGRRQAEAATLLEQDMPGYSRIQLSDWFLEFMKDNRDVLLNIGQWRQLPEDVQTLAAKHLGQQCEVSDLLALLDGSISAVRWWAAYHLAIIDRVQDPHHAFERGRMRVSRIKFPDERLSQLTKEQYRRMWYQIQCNTIEVLRSLHQPTPPIEVPPFFVAAKVIIESAERTAGDVCMADDPAEIATRWRRILLSTETNKSEAEKILLEWYKFWQCPPPSEILWCQSPVEGALAAIKRGLQALRAVHPVPSMPLQAGQLNLLMQELVSAYWEGFRNPSWLQFPMHAALLDAIGSVSDCVRRALFDDIQSTPDQWKLNPLTDSDIRLVVDLIVQYSCFAGQLEWEWLLALETLISKGAHFPLYEILAGAAEHCGFWWAFRDCLIVTEKPQIISLDEQERLHSLTGPALKYADGWSLYRINGIEVPPMVVLEPEKISIDMIEEEANVELRRIFIDRYGPQRFMRDCKAHAIDTTKHGVLYRKGIEDDESIVMVKVVNATPEPDGSRKEYFLRVPPHITSVEQAIAWTFAMEADEYKPVIET